MLDLLGLGLDIQAGTAGTAGPSPARLALTGYCLLATLSLLAMELYTVWAPDAAQTRLHDLRTWLEGHQEQLVISLALLAGLWLTGSSIYALAP
ncbi:GAP family protein [Streptomyces sp. NPDC032472]|uniref:GAP family protein n=1 Tax=Streptomyces sp. NPDC032472 TaxID=3155018 RepID=UPI0033D01786